jgi:hypothetical protein
LGRFLGWLNKPPWNVRPGDAWGAWSAVWGGLERVAGKYAGWTKMPSGEIGEDSRLPVVPPPHALKTFNVLRKLK